jgi:hypothetical protein
MKTPCAVVFVAALTVGILSVQMPIHAQDLPGPPGDPKSEALIAKQLGETGAQIQREVEKDSTTVLDRMRAASAVKAKPSTQAIEINNMSGVPGDPRFEAQLTRMLEDANHQATADAANDPTIQR